MGEAIKKDHEIKPVENVESCKIEDDKLIITEECQATTDQLLKYCFDNFKDNEFTCDLYCGTEQAKMNNQVLCTSFNKFKSSNQLYPEKLITSIGATEDL